MRLACVQSNVIFSEPRANLEHAKAKLRELKSKGVDLAVFPEAFLTGYCVSSREEALDISIPRDGSIINELKAAADELGMVTVVGFAEVRGEDLYNTAVLIEPGRENRFYSKTHLPELGYDKFVLPGEEMPVFDTRLGKIGVLICFDLRPPEACRVEALAGADLIVLPTNWPEGAQFAADVMAPCRAAESGVFLATCDRVGTENGFSFIGLSKIISPRGKVLAEAGPEEETIIADVDLAQARNKRIVGIPGKYEMTIFDSRRPELYKGISEVKEPALR